MSSTNTNNPPDKPGESQSGASLVQQHSAVSPLLDNIIGGAERFAVNSEESVSPESLELEVPASNEQFGLSPAAEGEQSASPEPPAALLSELPPDSNVELDLQSESSPLSQNSNSSPLEDTTIQQSQAIQEQPSLSEQYGDAGLLAELNALAQTQQFQLEQHREYVLRSRAEQDQQIENWQMRCAALEEQLQEARDRVALLEQRHLASQSQVFPLEAQRDAAQQVTERLQTEILDRRQQQATLEEQLQLAEETLREQQEISAAQSRGIVAMQAELSKAQAEVTALETRLSHQEHLRQQLKADGSRDRQDRSQARDRQLQLEQETTQMTGQLLRLSEELRQAQRQSNQWRRQAQAQTEQLRGIAHWAAQADSVPPELMALLEPLFHAHNGIEDEQQPISLENGETHHVAEISNSTENHPSSLDLPSFPHGNV